MTFWEPANPSLQVWVPALGQLVAHSLGRFLGTSDFRRGGRWGYLDDLGGLKRIDHGHLSQDVSIFLPCLLHFASLYHDISCYIAVFHSFRGFIFFLLCGNVSPDEWLSRLSGYAKPCHDSPFFQRKSLEIPSTGIIQNGRKHLEQTRNFHDIWK